MHTSASAIDLRQTRPHCCSFTLHFLYLRSNDRNDRLNEDVDQIDEEERSLQEVGLPNWGSTLHGGLHTAWGGS